MERNARSRVTATADLVLAGTGLLCVLALGYFVYHYSWIGDRQFASVAGLIARYGLPTALAVTFFGALRLRASIRQNFALLIVSTGLSLLCAELVLEALRPRHTTLWTPVTKQDIDVLVSLAEQFGVEYDTRTQLQVVTDLRLQGVDAFPSIYPMGLFVRQTDGTVKSRISINDVEVQPLSGISDKLTVFCNEAGEWMTYQSDEQGFHNPPGLWSSEVLDIAVLGDSYAQGACVPSDRNFVALIRSRYPATLNLGNSNKGPLMALADLREYAAAFKPKSVLWFFYELNDFADLGSERNSPLLMRYLDEKFHQDLVSLRAELDGALEQFFAGTLENVQTRWPEEKRAIIPDVLRLYNLRRGLGLMPRPVEIDVQTELEQTSELLTEILSEARKTVDSWDGTLYLVYLPERERYVSSRAADLDEARRQQVMRVAHRVGVEFIDVHAAFQASGDPVGLFPFRRRGHYNEAGHRLVAEAVLKALSSH